MNVQGQRLADDPAPIIYIGPTKSNIEKVIEPRWTKMIRGVPALWDQLAKGKSSSKTLKLIAGVEVRFAWAGSPTELAGQNAAIVEIDELDRMKKNVGGEGSPLEMAEARLESYADGVSIVTSTPTEGNVDTYTDEHGLERWAVAEPEEVGSAIWKLFQGGTRHEWAWPCPHCAAYFIPRFRLLVWPKDASPQRAKREARLQCPHCAALIDDTSKVEMNSRGVFVAPGQRVTNDGVIEGEPEENDTASFWVSGLCSPWRSFGDRARSYLEAVRSGDIERIKGVINTRFGELFRVGGEAPDWQRVADLRRDYGFDEIPAGVQILSCGVDVQKRSLIWTVRGWAPRYESWLIRHGEFMGETEHDHVWLELARLLLTPINGQRIQMMLIDSGFRPGDKWRRPDNQIYKFCRAHLGLAFPSKGHESQDKPIKVSAIDITLSGKTIKEGLQLFHLDSDFFKSWIHSRIDWPEDQPGGWHLARETTDDFCQQIVSEGRVVLPSGRVRWIRTRRANHDLDAEALNTAAAYAMNVHLLTDPQPKAATPAAHAPSRGTRSTGVEI
jgi:phage terminase large subunit GpA-like protein